MFYMLCTMLCSWKNKIVYSATNRNISNVVLWMLCLRHAFNSSKLAIKLHVLTTCAYSTCSEQKSQGYRKGYWEMPIILPFSKWQFDSYFIGVTICGMGRGRASFCIKFTLSSHPRCCSIACELGCTKRIYNNVSHWLYGWQDTKDQSSQKRKGRQ